MKRNTNFLIRSARRFSGSSSSAAAPVSPAGDISSAGEGNPPQAPSSAVPSSTDANSYTKPSLGEEFSHFEDRRMSLISQAERAMIKANYWMGTANECNLVPPKMSEEELSAWAYGLEQAAVAKEGRALSFDEIIGFWEKEVSAWKKDAQDWKKACGVASENDSE